MAAESESFFVDHFLQLTTQKPYPWQKQLFLNFIAEPARAWPEVVGLPTGAGKTSVLYVWLLALAWSIRTKAFGVPRRLAWIVNRRVVVDQVTTELEKLLKRINDPDSQSPELRDLLASVSLTGSALAVSTLRGQFADNGDWSRDPSTPAVVVGTVDMIGSRLLFRGYRASGYYRPIHAGLLGVDTLIVNDEAHLSPALAQLLTKMRDRQPAEQIPGKCFRILLLSATSDPPKGLRKFEHEIEDDAKESEAFQKIFRAPKSLLLREVGSANELEAAIWALATESPVRRTAIFIEQPEKAAKLAERLRKDNRRVRLLTGTMRGYERDGLAEDDIFKRFTGTAEGEPVWLVCTSAGEVGINFSCERMITGLTEADHLLQRFGRLNRFGELAGEAHVVFRKPSDKESRLQNTLAYLRGLDGDISCAKIWTNRAPQEACTDRPTMAILEDRHIDIWSQTNYHDRSVPAVASWLHGKQESEAPDTEVVWRSDIQTLTEWEIASDQIQKVLEYYPVLAREKITEPAYRVAEKLGKIAERMGPSAALKKLIVVESDGTPSICDLSYLIKQTEKNRNFLGYKMVLLPEGLGSVPAGMFHDAAPDEGSPPSDVADRVGNGQAERIRFLFSDGENATLVPTRDVPAASATPPKSSSHALKEYAGDRYRPALVVEHSDDEDRRLVYFGARSERSSRKSVEIFLPVHQDNVAEKAQILAGKVGLFELADTYKTAGKVHDNGKARDVWQRAMGGKMENPIAKSKAPVNLRLIDGYRHELGSLLDALRPPNGETDDLLLHLIASHHKAARPFFETRQYDTNDLKESAKQTIETARRYARLQARYGAWGLAYLEAIFKCADGIVSSEEGDAASA